MRTPLYGHVSEDTAYVVNDYPYSFRLRCEIRYWIESKLSKGYRFVSQTKNPKTGLWNAPKRSTYMELGANLYLDEVGHVQWSGLSQYDSVEKVYEFVRDFPGNPGIRDLGLMCLANIKYLDRRVEGKATISINGVPQYPSKYDIARAYYERDCWKYILMGTPLNLFYQYL